MWIDREWSSTHSEGHRLAAFPEGKRVDWWFYHRDHRRERMQSVGPEPLGPFKERDEAKAAALEAYGVNNPEPRRGAA